MMNLFRRHNNKNTDYSFLQIDMHNHLLPGLDDGVAGFDESISILKKMKELGYCGVYVTPHVMSALYPNSSIQIERAFNLLKVQEQIPNKDFPILIDYAAEYFLDREFCDLRLQHDLLHFGDRNVLIEMSFIEKSAILEYEIFKLQLLGYQPVLAHVERYGYLNNSISFCQKLLNMGCHLQLNLLSLTGHYGSKAKKFAFELLNNELYQWAGTDIHNMKHVILLDSMRKENFFLKLTEYPFLNLTLNNKLIRM